MAAIHPLTVVAGGTGYNKYDTVEVITLPVCARATNSLAGKMNDPRGELNSVAFMPTVEIQGNVEQFGNVYTISYLPDDLNPIYFSARALYGDDEICLLQIQVMRLPNG